MELRGSTALVTGGAVRVGRAISLALAAGGARVIVHFNRSADDAREVVREIEGAGGSAAAVGADLSDLAEVRRLCASVEAEHGPVDILVNNASVFPAAAFHEVDESTWERAIGVNLRAPFFL